MEPDENMALFIDTTIFTQTLFMFSMETIWSWSTVS